MSKEPGRPRVLAVTSGKGGVGKTNLAVNLALCLRLFNVNVLLLDADMGMASVDVLLGLHIQHNLRDVLLKGWPVEQVVVEGPRGLKILPGACGVEELARLDEPRFEAFLQQVQRYCEQMDFVVVDTAPGISPAVVSCLLAADETLLVTNPEPTSLTDAYAVLKVMSGRPEGRAKAVWVIMNQTGSKEEAVRSFDRLRAAASRFLYMDIHYLGSVAWDDTVSEATKRQVAFLTHYSASPCSRDVRKIAARLVSAGHGGSADIGRFFRAIGEVGHE